MHASITPEASAAFPSLLKAWRSRRRVSQLDLSLSSGVSQRHVSFLETGRAKPSRDMVLLLSEALEVPLRYRNEWLAAAGFAPLFHARALEDPQMEQVLAALRMMLRNHEPFPAIVVDRAWNIRMSNAPFDRLTDWTGGDVWTRIGGPERNMMRLFFHPEGVRPLIRNWTAIAPLLWSRARHEAEALGGEELKQLLAELTKYQASETISAAETAPLLPVLPVEIAAGETTISLFTVISTFGTAQDVTADELRVESFFPADKQTESMFRAQC